MRRDRSSIIRIFSVDGCALNEEDEGDRCRALLKPLLLRFKVVVFIGGILVVTF